MRLSYVLADNTIEVLRPFSDRFKMLTRDNGLASSEHEGMSDLVETNTTYGIF